MSGDIPEKHNVCHFPEYRILSLDVNLPWRQKSHTPGSFCIRIEKRISEEERTMPIYEYECRKCGEEFESFRGLFENDKKVACPVCGEKGPRRIMSKAFTKGAVNKGNLTFPT